jgi:hypothetical protein
MPVIFKVFLSIFFRMQELGYWPVQKCKYEARNKK